MPLVLLVAGCGDTPDESSYADRDWSAVEPAVADVPVVREPAAALTRANLRALDPCAVGAAGDPDAAEPPVAASSCTIVREEGTVEVDTAARYLVDSGPDQVNALDSRDRTEIAGVAAWVGAGPTTTGGDSVPCAVVVPASLELALTIADADPGCAAATAAAEAALAALRAVSRPGRGVTEPVFYAADEPDPGGVGDCGELADQLAWLCAPVGETGPEATADPVELIRHGEADPQVLCGPALEPAREAVEDGPTWVAVTTAVSPQELDERSSYDGPRQCTLASTSGTIMVSSRRQPLGTAANADVGGHPAYHDEISGTWEVALTEVGEHGFLRITVLDADRAEPAWAADVVEDLVQRAFG